MLWDDAAARAGREDQAQARREDPPRRAVLRQGLLRPLEAREAAGIDDVYLLRVEQLYPFPARALITELGRFPQAEVVWCQEEPKNMGAWSFIEPNLEWVLQHLDADAQAARAMPAARPRPRRRPGLSPRTSSRRRTQTDAASDARRLAD